MPAKTEATVATHDDEPARWHIRWSRHRTFVVLTDRRSRYRRNFHTVKEAKAFVRTWTRASLERS